jgi:hypothetical protein
MLVGDYVVYCFFCHCDLIFYDYTSDYVVYASQGTGGGNVHEADIALH